MFRQAVTAFWGLVSVCLVNYAMAQKVYIDTPTTIDYTVTDSQGQNAYAVIGSVNTDPFTVNIVDGASLLRGGEVDNQATVNISGGQISDPQFPNMLYAYGTSRLNISGGSFAATLELNDNSIATVTNGSFQRGLLSQYGSTANIYGGFFTGNGYWSVSSGAGGSNTINIYGGQFVSPLGIFAAGQQATINVYGTNLVISGSSNMSTGLIGMLTGTLQDGTSIDQNVYGTAQNIILHNSASVPEADSLVILLLGGLLGVGTQRRSHRHSK